MPLSPTFNLDLAALGAFLTWVRDVEGLALERAKPPRERESRGCERWLSSEELSRLQKLLGHATPLMTMGYMKHAPEAYLDEDAAAIAAHMLGATDREPVARIEAAWREIRPA